MQPHVHMRECAIGNLKRDQGCGSGGSLRIGLAAARSVPSVEERLRTVDRFLKDAGALGAAIVRFPEAYIPGWRGQDFAVPPHDQRLAVEGTRQIGGRG